MKSKKLMSARMKEFVTDGVMACCMIGYGMIGLLWEASLYSVIFMAVILAVMVGSLLMRRYDSEPWDEVIRGHYADARRWTIFAQGVALLTVAFTLLVLRSSIRISYGSILVILGLSNLFQTLAFIWIDRKRTAVKEA